MVSRAWSNLLLWGLGDRLENRNDYKTDILMILDVMNWYSVLVLSGKYGGFPTFWLLSIVVLPASWLGTQLAVGYVMVRKGRAIPMKKPVSAREASPRPAGGSESEEP